MALQLHQAIPKNATPRVHFTLPETSFSLDLEAEVAWADLKGRVGLRFRNVPPGSQEHLEKWLNQQVQKKLPEAKDAAGAASEAIQ